MQDTPMLLSFVASGSMLYFDVVNEFLNFFLLVVILVSLVVSIFLSNTVEFHL